MSYVFQVRIKSIKVKENGSLNIKETSNYISASLIYPKEGIPSIETVREVKLQDEKPFRYSDLQFPESLIFKQSFQGDSFIQIKFAFKRSNS